MSFCMVREFPRSLVRKTSERKRVEGIAFRRPLAGIHRPPRLTQCPSVLSFSKRRLRLRAQVFAGFIAFVIAVGTIPTGARGAAPQPKPSPIAAVIQVTVIPAARAAAVVRGLFPNVSVRVDSHANAIVIYGSPDDVQAARSVVSGIDVRNPSTPAVDVIQLRISKPADIVARVGPLFPGASLSVASKSSVLLRATPIDGGQIKALIAGLDTAPPTSAPPTMAPVDAVAVKNARPRDSRPRGRKTSARRED